MKKIFLTLILILFYGFLQAQATNTEVVNLNSENYFDDDIVNPLIINSTINAIMFGRIEGPEEESDVFVLITPKPGVSITISQYFFTNSGVYPGTSTQGGAVATVIRPKKPGIGGGRLLKSETSSSNVVLYPNPVENEFTISSSLSKITQYSIYDQLGRNLIEIKLNPAENITIDSTKLQAGTYFLQLEFENNQKNSIQFIKN